MKRARSYVIIIGAALALIAPAIWSGGVLLPLDILHHLGPFSPSIPNALQNVKNPHLSDLVTQFYPWLDFFCSAGKTPPLWNPYSFCGSPLFANAQTTFLFPFTWISLALPTAAASLLIAVSKLLFCGIFAYLLYRKIGICESASLLGALTFMLGGHLMVWLGYPASYPIVTLPFLFWSLERFISTRTRNGAAWMALAYGLLFIAGQPQTGLVIALGSLAYFAVRARSEALPTVRSWAYLAFALALGCCIAAPQILPFLEYLRESAAFRLRGPLGWKEYPWFTVTSWIMPRFFGDPRNENFWGFSSFLGEALYIGAVPLILATMGAIRSRKNCFGWAVAAVFLPAVLGLYVRPAQNLFSHIPLLSHIDNNKLLVLATFGLASFAAAGLNELMATDASRRSLSNLWTVSAFLWIGLVSAVFFFFRKPIDTLRLARFELLEAGWLAALLVLGSCAIWAWRMHRLPSTRLAFVCVSLTVVDLLRMFVGYNPAFPAAYLRPASSSMEFLQENLGEGRFMGLRGVLPPELSVLYRVQDARGYDALTPYRHYSLMGRVDPELHDLLSRLRAGAAANDTWTSATLFYRSLERYTQSADPELLHLLRQADYWNHEIGRIDRPNLLSILGVRYLLCPLGDPLPARAGMALVHSSDAQIWENPDCLPKAFISTRPVYARSDEEALDIISDPGFDLKSSAVIVADRKFPEKTDTAVPATEALIPARILHYAPELVELSAESDQEGWLVLSDLYYPGWQARLDGAPVPIFPANYLFRAVRLPPGNHRVVFTYRPKSFYFGAALSLAALVILAAVAIASRRTTSRNVPAPS